MMKALKRKNEIFANLKEILDRLFSVTTALEMTTATKELLWYDFSNQVAALYKVTHFIF